MRVGIIIYGSINRITGGYIYDKKLLEHLLTQGVKVKIFSQPDNNLWQRFRNNFRAKIIDEIIQFSPDVLLQDGMNYFSLFLLNKKIKQVSDFPIVCIVNLVYSCIVTNRFKKLVINKIEKFYFKSIDGFIFNSISTREAVNNLIGNSKNSLIAYPGKDRLQSNLQTGISFADVYNKQLMIMFIGNLTYNKGLHILLKALTQIEQHYWHLSVIGSTEFDLAYSKKIMTLTHHLKLNNKVKFLEVLNDQQLRKQFSRHHVVAVPSYYESYGIIYAEAMGAGLPVIATHSGGAKEIITNRINGFLVNPGDINMIRDVLKELTHNRELLGTMRRHSLSAYNKLSSWNESMEEIHLFLKAISCHSNHS